MPDYLLIVVVVLWHETGCRGLRVCAAVCRATLIICRIGLCS